MYRLFFIILLFLTSFTLKPATQTKGVIAPDFLFKRYESKCKIRHTLKPYILSHNKSYLDKSRKKIQIFLNKLITIIIHNNNEQLKHKFKSSDFCIDVYDDWDNSVSMISEEYYGQIHFGTKLFTKATDVEELAFILSHEIAHFTMSHTNTLDVENALILHRDVYKDKLFKKFIKKLKEQNNTHNIYCYDLSSQLFPFENNKTIKEVLKKLSKKSSTLYGHPQTTLYELEADEIGHQLYLNAGFADRKDLLLFLADDCSPDNRDEEQDDLYIATCTRNKILNKTPRLSPKKKQTSKKVDFRSLQKEFLQIKQEYQNNEYSSIIP